jgi:hypothetical protein
VNNQAPFNHIAQLAHISRPSVGLECLHGAGSHGTDIAAHTGAKHLQKVPCQHGNVVAALSQRRHADGKYILAIEKILAELALPDRSWRARSFVPVG